MGDLRILDPRMDPRLGNDGKHRPWPPMYRNSPSRGPSFCYRPMLPVEPISQWLPPHLSSHDYNYLPTRMPGNKGRDYYYLTPLYRNAMPPPPAGQTLQVPAMGLSPRMMLMEGARTRAAKSSGGHGRSSLPPCTCSVGRTRSLEDVRSEISEWEDYNDENGNHVTTGHKGRMQSRRSMENLLDVEGTRDVNFERCGKSDLVQKFEGKRNARLGRRRGSYMVRCPVE